MKKLFITTTFLVISFAFAITIANAQGLNDASSVFKEIGGQAGASTYENPEDVIGVGIGAAITLVGMIFLVLMVYAGYLWMTARGEQEQVDKAQKIITTALIGFFIVASAYAITTFVSGKLGKSDGSDEGDGVPPPIPVVGDIVTESQCKAAGGNCLSWLYGEKKYTGEYDPSIPCDPGGNDPFDTSSEVFGTCNDKEAISETGTSITNTCCKMP